MLYPDSTHDTVPSLPFNSFAIVSRATLTIVVSTAESATPIEVHMSTLFPRVIATHPPYCAGSFAPVVSVRRCYCWATRTTTVSSILSTTR